MAGQPQARTFISYSRKDGAAFAAKLRKTLEKENLSVWQDLVALEGGRDWWSQIEDALKSKGLQHFVLVVTPASLDSPYVRREIRLARQEGKSVCPVKGPGLGDLGKLPRWLGQIYDIDLVEHKTTLIRVLQNESRQKRVPMMAPEPPADFVQRPDEFKALKRQLLDAKGDSVAAITAALRGAGGYGKTTLAKALAYDPDIQDAYFDGILWAELGEKPERLLSILSDLITLLTGERPALETINAAAAKLGEALGDRRILLVIDDAWRDQDLRPFLQGPNTVRLVTTRIDSVLPATAIRQPVDAMKASEALQLLAFDLPPRASTNGSTSRAWSPSIRATRLTAPRRSRGPLASASISCPSRNVRALPNSASFPRARTYPSAWPHACGRQQAVSRILRRKICSAGSSISRSSSILISDNASFDCTTQSVTSSGIGRGANGLSRNTSISWRRWMASPARRRTHRPNAMSTSICRTTSPRRRSVLD